MESNYLLAGLLAYIIAGRTVMRRLTGGVRETALAVFNVTGVFFFLFYGNKEHYALRFGIYVALIAGLYLAVWLFAEKRGGWPWLAFFAPIAALIVVRYVPASAYVALGQALGKSWHGAPNMVGISYLAFRCSRLVLGSPQRRRRKSRTFSNTSTSLFSCPPCPSARSTPTPISGADST